MQMDLVGTFLLMAAVVCYLLALQWAGTSRSWSDSTIIGMLVGFVLIFALFGLNEFYMGDRALMQPRLLKQRRIWTTNAFVFFVAGSFFSLIYYLPIYFQSIQGTDPFTSGVRNLPIVVGCLLCVVTGFLVGQWGIWVPFIVVGAALGTIGCGLCYTFDIGTTSDRWIGFQALAGIGMGMGMQIPIMANQAAVGMADISSVSAITLCFQIIGGSFSVSAAQAAFANTIANVLPTTAPNVSVGAVLGVGATAIRSAFPEEDLPGILEAYMQGIKVVFALSTALVGISFLFALMPKWEKLRPEPPKTEGAGTV